MQNNSYFPRLKTCYQGPLAEFEQSILTQSHAIEAWFKTYWEKMPALITTSVDLRVSHNKIVPIDTNIFPAGFNNLSFEMQALATEAMQAWLVRQQPDCRRILIVAENHTRNHFYYENLFVLSQCFSRAGYDVKLGRIDMPAEQVEVNDGLLVLNIVEKNQDGQLCLGDFVPSVIILNHDLSSGIPPILQNIKQPLYPSTQLGWWNRSKAKHFSLYMEIVRSFGQHFSIDTHLLSAAFTTSEPVDFMTKLGFEPLAKAVEQLIESSPHIPFVTIKADNGTYGMGVMMVNNGEDVLRMNRRQRSHMTTRKGGDKVTRVLVQEGIETIESMDGHTAEPVIYMIGNRIVGGFYRVHPKQSSKSSLNSPGMYFKACDFEVPSKDDYSQTQSLTVANRFYIYGVVARLAALAAALE